MSIRHNIIPKYYVVSGNLKLNLFSLLRSRPQAKHRMAYNMYIESSLVAQAAMHLTYPYRYRYRLGPVPVPVPARGTRVAGSLGHPILRLGT